MKDAENMSPGSLIKAGVSEHVEQQQQNPNAISNGVNVHKAFDTDPHGLHSSSQVNEDADKIAQPISSLHISPEAESPSTGKESVQARAEAEQLDADSSSPPSHPNIDIVSPEDAKFQEGSKSGPDDQGRADENAQAAEAEFGQKKKKKKKPKSQRGLNAPTGFEEYYVDPPITPEQHAEEKGLYGSSRPFSQRIETAIQRYFAKRNLDAERKNVFDKYLTYGGIAGGPKMFSGGLDSDTLNNGNAAEIATFTATHSVPFGPSDPRSDMYVVDFEGCLRGFLSSHLPRSFEVISEVNIKNYVGIIRNFLNYLLYHDVCPEYRDQIEASRKLCDQAQRELWQIAQLQPLVPGTFNMACSEIFGGVFQGVHNDMDDGWMTNEDKERMNIGISPQRARQVFKIGLAAHATDEQLLKYKAEMSGQLFKVVSTEEVSLEITSSVLGCSISDTQSLYAQDEAKDLPILGKLRARAWNNPGAADEDLTKEEEVALEANPPSTREYEFWLEDEVLKHILVGMKFQATVKQLSFGIYYFDAISGIHCSFFTILPNELMLGWKEIEKEWLLPRPGNDEKEKKINEDADVRDQEESVLEGQEVSWKLGQKLEATTPQL